MCWAEKCCYFIPLNLACVIIGFMNFTVSLSLMIASIATYFGENKMEGNLYGDQTHPIAKFLGLDLKMGTMNIILSIVVIVCVFWLIFSILLVVGVAKNESSLVLCYFSFGIILTILCQLSGLLILLQRIWWLALLMFTGSLINIHFLVVIHTIYELMLKGTRFGFGRHEQDEDPLADCFDETLA